MRHARQADDPALPEGTCVDESELVGPHVGDVEGTAVRGDPHVLGDAAPHRHRIRVLRGRVRVEVEDTDHPVPQRRDLEQLAGELTGDDEEASVAGEIGVVGPPAPWVLQVLDRPPAVRVGEPDGVVLLHHHDRRAAVGRVVEVVGPRHGHGARLRAGAGIDLDQLVRIAAVGDERPQVVRRDDVLAQVPGRDDPHDPVRSLADHRHPRAEGVGHVEQRGVVPHLPREHSGPGLGVDVVVAPPGGMPGIRWRNGGATYGLVDGATIAGVREGDESAPGVEPPPPQAPSRPTRRRRRYGAPREHAPRSSGRRPATCDAKSTYLTGA